MIEASTTSQILDVANHPVMTFRSTGVRPAGHGYLVTGDLTIRGVTRQVELTVEYLGVSTDPSGGLRAGFSAATAINRRDFGVDFNIPLDGDRLLLGDRIEIQLEIQAVRQD